MTIEFTCECGKLLRAQDEHAGRRTRCPACGRDLDIPRHDEAIQPAAASPTPSPVTERTPRRPRTEEDEERPRRREEDAPAESSGKALAALLLGLGSFCLWFLTGIPAVIFGILSLRDINRSDGRLTGKGLAITGLIIAGFNTLLLCPVAAVGIYFAGKAIRDKAKEGQARAKSSSNLKQIGLAIHNHENTFGHLPSITARQQFPQHAHSWRVHLLPYLDEEGLYKQYNFMEPWNGPNNSRLLTQMPKIYAHPLADPATTAAGKTHYRCFSGPSTALGDPNNPRPRFVGITDGVSNTIFIVEARDPVPWTQPEGIPFERMGGPPPLADFYKGGTLVLMGDGSVRVVRKDYNLTLLRAAITANGGEVLEPERALFEY